MNSCHKGFTLAEVLITLVIIGIIAAFTVPTLIQRTQNKEYSSKLKKAYSVLQQATHQIALNNGYAQGDYSFFLNDNFIEEFAKVVNTQKTCNTTLECFGTSSFNNYVCLNNSTSSTCNFTAQKSLITTDGLIYTVATNDSNYNRFGISDEDVANSLGRIVVDVNGQRKPNKIGIDTFIFFIVDKKGVVPAGAASTAECSRSSSGRTCAARVLREGDINY